MRSVALSGLLDELFLTIKVVQRAKGGLEPIPRCKILVAGNLTIIPRTYTFCSFHVRYLPLPLGDVTFHSRLFQCAPQLCQARLADRLPNRYRNSDEECNEQK